jgi:hypothetical protein
MSHRLIAAGASIAAVAGIALIWLTLHTLPADHPRTGVYLVFQSACVIVLLIIAVGNWALRD